ncbi:predicted protein [Sclerotinia sclerotiorum 1980 UF-70]|uniref:Uncharacterized protein n=1 Tax=Sclerotinia sclerotiorum (strain ATCC 18683 / 1980 / Ss-1) TaxID=665079 RepID=A7ETS8_SCLS1|nr:predicted protein [Sclerotinia sclerotiorum 1980 UF-70]EDN92870.1 predicted protein [Sclerotinia sclerotiorum 1980 UF-70]
MLSKHCSRHNGIRIFVSYSDSTPLPVIFAATELLSFNSIDIASMLNFVNLLVGGANSTSGFEALALVCLYCTERSVWIEQSGTFFRRSLSYFGTSLSPCVGFSSECQRVKTLYSPIARHFVPAFSRSLDWQLSAEYPPVVKCSEWKPVEPICLGKVELAPANFGHGL